MTRLTTILFDLDGTLIDSEKNYNHTDIKFLARHGVQVTEQDIVKFIGVGSEAFIQQVQETYGFPGRLADLLEEKNQIYEELAAQDTQGFPQMIRFLDLSLDEGLKVAIASGSSLSIIKSCLGWASIHQPFDLLISAEEVPNGKPAPDVFIEAARRLAVEPASCLVVEDSRPGVQAAEAAGMACVAVPYFPSPVDDPTYTLAQYYYPQGTHSFVADDLVHRLRADGRWA
ncbi:MAG: HAD family phosphatase [Spirochaetales bacterium]|nr:HAD family phosphatase [Spirochaetales bacterium]